MQDSDSDRDVHDVSAFASGWYSSRQTGTHLSSKSSNYPSVRTLNFPCSPKKRRLST